MNKPSVYILLPVHNRREITMSFAECLLAQEGCSYHLLLLDDGSMDGTADSVLKLLGNRVTVLRGDGNWWWAGALQSGVDWLKSQKVSEEAVILIINDDLEIAPDFLAEGVEELLTNPNCLLLAKQVNAQTGVLEGAGGGLLLDSCRMRFTPAKNGQGIGCLPTRGLFCRLGDVLKVGEFRPKLLPHYFSDYEFTIRARRKGMLLKVSEHVCVMYTLDTTGERTSDLKGKGIVERVKFTLSFRFHGNPLHYTQFALMVTPTLKLPVALVWIWGNWLLKIFGVRSR